MPEPVSETTISTATSPAVRRPVGSSKYLHTTEMFPCVVYFTGAVKGLLNHKRPVKATHAKLTGISSQVRDHRPDLPRVANYLPRAVLEV